MRTTIGIYPAAEFDTRRRLWDALAALFAVEFVATREPARDPALDAAVICCATKDEAAHLAGAELRSLVFIDREERAVGCSPARVTTTNASKLRRCLHNRSLPDRAIDRIATLAADRGDEVFARIDGEPFWLQQQRAGSISDFVAAAPPDLKDGDFLFEHFQSERWARLLPLLHFLQDVSGWAPPPLRAALIFDDPNLHWTSYGYINYRALAEDARERNYHVSCATIPLDGWYVHPQTAALFRQHRERLSLSIHGNNHTYYELTEVARDDERVALAAQALRRIERFESSAGVPVSRVMAAPHGACNHAMADALRRTGFEAACISRSSVMLRNPETKWPSTIGMTPAEFLGAGLPVYPRYNIRWDDSYPIFAAFLGQPVVAVGHHDDAADSLSLIRRTADLINSLGEVQWLDLQRIARSNFVAQTTGETSTIRMYSRKLTFRVPPNVSRIAVERPWRAAASDELALERDGRGAQQSNGSGPVFAVEPCETITLSSIAPDRLDSREVAPPKTPIWAVARRQLCEGRDRLRPAIDSVLTRKTRR